MNLPKGTTYNDVCNALFPMYQKFLKVNLTTGEYENGSIPSDELEALGEVLPATINDYWEWFVKSNFIHEDDREQFLNFVSTADACKSLLYRRLLNGEWKWVAMRLTPFTNYSPDNKECLLYVCDIDSLFNMGYEFVQNKIGTTDSMTGLRNGLAFEKDSKNLKSDAICVIFADLNKLKYTNDNFGHKAGNELIKGFANTLKQRFGTKTSYHISGDEFIITSDGSSARELLRNAKDFHKSLWNGAEPPIASVGYSCGSADEFDDIVKDAEDQMYLDKNDFYTQYPEYRRK